MSGRVYPRVCGGTGPLRASILGKYGLSPRVRGNLLFLDSHKVLKGSIPACAGEPSFSIIADSGVNGLSPRVRGNRLLGPCADLRQRSIPACAGEPAGDKSSPASKTVYPRVCGGTSGTALPSGDGKGLSPRVRGNHVPLFSEHKTRRSIPACAGEPSCEGLQCDTLEVYPRVCGGTDFIDMLDIASKGLSPRVRGNPTTQPNTTAQGVYPRVCGGTHYQLRLLHHTMGLSPRVRGNRRKRNRNANGKRSIPACAGEPKASTVALPPTRVYPRVCGGAADAKRTAAQTNGLSPRVRGSLAAIAAERETIRSIPACAGEPCSG